ncbi:MAG: retropepsin-like aspartic protease [Acetobacteraceae bacterium]|nr:retropepsin-like aspartic protease [Acetobacteraceae bacterium]
MKLSILARLATAAGALASCEPAPLVMGVLNPERSIAAPQASEAPNCTLQRRASLPVTLAGLPMVMAVINGQPSRLVLDTGAESSIISLQAAKRLGVTNKYDFARSMKGIAQSMQTGDARLDSMSLGGAKLAYPRVLVGPLALSMGGLEPDGLLGASLLADFDLDLDLPHRRLDLYAPTNCPSLRPPWSGPYTALETTRSLTSHPFFPIHVNGRTLSASLDSGAQRTVIAAAAAQRAGVSAASRVPGSEVRARGAAGEILPAELHRLADLRVGDVPVRTPVLVTALTLPNDIDALLGADFLQSHRVWLSYESRRLFIQ